VALGPEWDAAVPVIQVLGVAGTLMVVGQLSVHLMTVHGALAPLVWITMAGVATRVALLAVLIPLWGVPGAAWAAALAIGIEQTTTLTVVFRRFGISAGDFARLLWRPALGTAAMALVLTGTGLGWAPAEGAFPILPLLLAAAAGAAVYTTVLLVAWLVAGRPQGAEADGMTLLRRLVQR
jgi:O-antigen/teichoic acid export membrane protein